MNKCVNAPSQPWLPAKAGELSPDKVRRKLKLLPSAGSIKKCVRETEPERITPLWMVGAKGSRVPAYTGPTGADGGIGVS